MNKILPSPLHLEVGSTHCPPSIPSDSIVLILGNLIQNSIEALSGKKDGEIQLTFCDQPDQLILAVEDNGPGISSKDLHQVFEKGFSTKQRSDGEVRGYGLYLVKNHVEQVLGGKIELDSSPDEGTSVLIFIPKKG